MSRRSSLALLIAACASLTAAAPVSAGQGSVNVLVTGNCNSGAEEEMAVAIAAEPGIASATPFDTSAATPEPADLATRDLVVSTGDCTYDDPALWGNRLADYVDAGGAVLQTAYDNWNETPPSDDPAPAGRWASGGYPPLLLGPNDNIAVTLGEILVPSSPIVQGLGAFPSANNTTTPLAPGATLLAKWSDGRNAIAIKGRVVATSATAAEANSVPSIARLARNTVGLIRRYQLTVAKAGAGTGTVTSSPAAIACGSVCTAAVPFATSLSLTATADAGSAFVGWSGACSGSGACAVTIDGSDVQVGAVFASRARCGNPQAGTSGPDTLTGSRFGDRLSGGAANDVLRGLGGDDCLSGAGGNDRLFGASGKDRLTGGRGSDRLSGGSRKDRLTGGPGRDRLSGGGGIDRLSGGKGRDVVSGGAGRDVINSAGGGKDRVKCGPGRDRVRVDEDDKLSGCERVKVV
jgi:Ca2+-binding RTX toxin-like protein